MDAATYAALSRQSGLQREMQVVAHNIANMSTAGFRREGMVFAEHVKRMGDAPSLSLAHANTRRIDLSQGGVTRTGGTFDLAIRGDGFFLVETPQGQRLTRAGSFTPTAEGQLVTPDGHILLDAGGVAVEVPPGSGPIAIARDGTLSAGGQPLAQIGLWQPADPLTLRHEAGTLFSAGAVDPVPDAQVMQGFLEDSNVNPVAEITRMIEVQRAYEAGQALLDRENDRIGTVIQTLGR